MSPVDLFAALTGTSGAASAQPKGAAGAGADFLSVLAAIQGDGAAPKTQGAPVDPDAAPGDGHDLKGELLSGAALFMAPAAPVAPGQPLVLSAGNVAPDSEGEAQPPVPTAPNARSGSGEPADDAASALPARTGAPVPAAAARPSLAQGQVAPDQPDAPAPTGAPRVAAGGEPATADQTAANPTAAMKAAETALAARNPQGPVPPVAVPTAPPVPVKGPTAPIAPDAAGAQADDNAAARLTAAAGPASTAASDGKTSGQAAAPATGETALQVRQMVRARGEAEADTRRDGRQERLAPAQFRLNGETGATASNASGQAGAPAPTANAPVPATASPPAFAAPATEAPPQAPAPEILPAATTEALPADTLEAAAEAETVRLQELAAARTSSPGSQLARATVETTALIASQIIRRLDGRATRFDMALTPAGLGRVDVRVEIDSDGRLAARLAFDNPAAATDLRGRADELRRELQEAGFQLAEDSLDFSDREQGSARHAFEREDRAFRGAGRLNAEADEAVAPPAPARWRSLSLTPEGVDMKV